MSGLFNGNGSDNEGRKFWTWAFRTILIMLIGILIIDRDNDVRDLRAQLQHLSERLLKVEVTLISEDRSR